MRYSTAILVMVTSLGSPLAAQDGTHSRLEGRVSPDVARTVSAIADSVARHGLPVEPLYRKAIEGGAKGVPAVRIVAAVRIEATHLAEAAGALRSAGVDLEAETVEAGGYAINAGLTPKDVTDMARSTRVPETLAASLRSSGTLVALGVPAGQAVALVQQWVQAGRSPTEVLLLPHQLQAAMARGAPPAQAAAEVGRGSPPATTPSPGRAPPTPPGQDRRHRP